jgi:hypothetical protein
MYITGRKIIKFDAGEFLMKKMYKDSWKMNIPEEYSFYFQHMLFS